jgi:hypothetical protein
MCDPYPALRLTRFPLELLKQLGDMFFSEEDARGNADAGDFALGEQRIDRAQGDADARRELSSRHRYAF